MTLKAWINATLVCLSLSWGGAGHAYEPHSLAVPNQTPEELKGIGIDERLGNTVDLNLPFVADDGEAVTLGKYFSGHKPVLLTVVYYNCPGLCNLHLNGVTAALKQMSMTPGDEFELVAVTMDHTETAAVASAKKANYINQYGRPESAGGWHFLTGSKENIETFTKSVGFNFRWDEASQQFAHASAAIIMTPGGAVSRYIHGIQPEPRDLRLALLEASNGKIGSIVDKLVMFCFQFDPKKSKYTIYAWNLMRVGVVLTVLIFAILMIPAWVRVKE